MPDLSPDFRLNGWEPFAGWGTNETIALVTLIVTVVGLGWTTINTYRSSKSAQKLLENELRATLDIPSDPFGDQMFRDGLEVYGVQNLTEGGPQVHITGTVRNIGRYVARDINLTPFHGHAQGNVQNQPQRTLFPMTTLFNSTSTYQLCLWIAVTSTAASPKCLHRASRRGWYSRSRTEIRRQTRTRCASRLLRVRNRTHGFRRGWSVKSVRNGAEVRSRA